ncbi:MAG: RraA family protein [Candidatus Sumerlaeia bacterium]
MVEPKRTLAGVDELEAFKKISATLYAGAISDIMDEMGFRHQAIDPTLGIRALHPSMVAIGRALTFQNGLSTRMDEPYEKAIEGLDSMQPGQLTIAGGYAPVEGIMGELSATAIRKRGGVGAVVNGFTRDGRKLLDMKFPVFAKGISPIDTTGRIRVVDYNVPLQFGHIAIKPGQIVFADYDGILVIPTEAEDEIIAKALERAEVETKVREALAAGESMDTVWKRYHVL